MVVLILTVAAVFPSVEGSAELSDLVESYPDSFKALFGLSGAADISTGPGFIDAELFSFMLPLLVLVLGIGAGARTLAGEEDAGRLELIFAYLLRRRSAVLAKGLGVGGEVTILCAVTFAALRLLTRSSGSTFLSAGSPRPWRASACSPSSTGGSRPRSARGVRAGHSRSAFPPRSPQPHTS